MFLTRLRNRIPRSFIHLYHRIAIPLRYDIEVRGVEVLEKLPQDKGVLFLSSHPSHMDGSIISLNLMNKGIKVTIWAYDFVFKQPYTRWASKKNSTVRMVKVPNVPEVRNDKYPSKVHKLINRTVDNLRKGVNYLIFPAGRCKYTSREKINGKSAVHKILRMYPNVPIVLVNIKGMWGSRFSWAAKRYSRWKNENMRWRELLWDICKMMIGNLFFFIPKRKLILEFMAVGSDFPRKGSRLQINKYLEKSFNAWFGPDGEEIQRVPDYFWDDIYVENECVFLNYEFDLKKVPNNIKEDITAIVAKKTGSSPRQIAPEMRLGYDLGLDSLEVTEILIELEQKFGIKKYIADDIASVGHLMAIVAGIPVQFEKRKIEFEELQF